MGITTLALTNSQKKTRVTPHNTFSVIIEAGESALSLNLTRKHKAKETTSGSVFAALGFFLYLR
jgi:hypothetical protein